MIKISIIVPVYNNEAFIGRCVDSILNQSFEDFEIIIVDDGSIDSTPDICTELEANNSCVKYIRINNSGVSTARNVGILNSSGLYIAFVDSDDELSDNFLSIMYQTIEYYNVDSCYCSHNVLNGEQVKLKNARFKEGFYENDSILDIILDDGSVTGILLGSVWAALYKRSVIISNSIMFKPQLKVNEDGIFNIDYILCTSSFYFVDIPLYQYRLHNEQSTKSYSKAAKTQSYLSEVKTFLIKEFEYKLPDFQLQLSRRNVSECIWITLSICDSLRYGNIIMSYKFINKLVSSKDVAMSFKFLDLKKVSFGKKIVLTLIRHKLCILLLVTLGIFKPIFHRVFKL